MNEANPESSISEIGAGEGSQSESSQGESSQSEEGDYTETGQSARSRSETGQGKTDIEGQIDEGEVNMEQQENVVAQHQTGKTTIADSVVAKIANIAAREVPGVHALGGATERAVSGAISKITGGGRSTGIDVEVGKEEAAVDVAMIVDYGQSIPDVANNVRQNIMNQVQAFTGLRVKEVNVTVNDLYFPGEGSQGGQGEQHEESSLQ